MGPKGAWTKSLLVVVDSWSYKKRAPATLSPKISFLLPPSPPKKTNIQLLIHSSNLQSYFSTVQSFRRPERFTSPLQQQWRLSKWLLASSWSLPPLRSLLSLTPTPVCKAKHFSPLPLPTTTQPTCQSIFLFCWLACKSPLLLIN